MPFVTSTQFNLHFFFEKVSKPGFEPGTFCVWGKRDNQLHHPDHVVKVVFIGLLIHGTNYREGTNEECVFFHYYMCVLNSKCKCQKSNRKLSFWLVIANGSLFTFVYFQSKNTLVLFSGDLRFSIQLKGMPVEPLRGTPRGIDDICS